MEVDQEPEELRTVAVEIEQRQVDIHDRHLEEEKGTAGKSNREDVPICEAQVLCLF